MISFLVIVSAQTTVPKKLKEHPYNRFFGFKIRSNELGRPWAMPQKYCNLVATLQAQGNQPEVTIEQGIDNPG